MENYELIFKIDKIIHHISQISIRSKTLKRVRILILCISITHQIIQQNSKTVRPRRGSFTANSIPYSM